MHMESGTAGLGTSVDELNGTERSTENGMDGPNHGNRGVRAEGASVIPSSHPIPATVPGEFEVRMGPG